MPSSDRDSADPTNVPRTNATAEIAVTKFSHRVLPNQFVLDVVNSEDKRRYEIEDALYYGAFGDVYVIRSLGVGENKYALRTEQKGIRKDLQQLTTMIKYLQKKPAVPVDFKQYLNIVGTAQIGDLTALIVDLVGPNLNDLRKYIVRANFSTSTAIFIAMDMYNAIRYLHKAHVVHRDLTMAAFCVNLGSDKNNIVLVSYGRLRNYKKPGKVSRVFVPNLTYCSRTAHQTTETLGLQDDRESWLYMAADVFDDSALSWKPLSKEQTLTTDQVLDYKEALFKGDKQVREQFFENVPIELEKLFDLINMSDVSEREFSKAAAKVIYFDIPKRTNAKLDRRLDWIGKDLILPWPKRPKMAKLEEELENLPPDVMEAIEKIEKSGIGAAETSIYPSTAVSGTGKTSMTGQKKPKNSYGSKGPAHKKSQETKSDEKTAAGAVNKKPSTKKKKLVPKDEDSGEYDNLFLEEPPQ